MSKKLRILFNSNAPWSISGYGQQMHDLLPLIKNEGYATGIINFYGQDGGKIVLDGITCYPKIHSQWGEDAMVDHGNDFKADVVFSLQDIWVLNPDALKRIKRWIPILPVDHDPMPPSVKDRLKHAYRIVSYSKFGEEELKRNGYYSTFIPHTVDTELFKPQPRGEVRKAMGIPEDIFLFGMVAANKDNPPRKSFQNVMDAYMMFKKNHPDVRTAIYFHTFVENVPTGFPIKEYAKFLGIDKEIYYPPTYDMMFRVGREQMHKIYSAMDCFLLPSTNEGFGVPAIEAQACGIPTIVTDFTAMPEMIIDGKTGYKVKVGWKRFSPLLSYIGHPDTEDIHSAMEKVFKADRIAMGKAARKHIVKNYDTLTVFKQKWVPYLDLLEKEIYPD